MYRKLPSCRSMKVIATHLFRMYSTKVILVLSIGIMITTNLIINAARADNNIPNSHYVNTGSHGRRQSQRRSRLLSPSVGENIHALVLLVQFPEHINLTLPSRDYIDTLCNKQIIPYLQHQSYNQYDVVSCDVQDWLMTEYTQEFYANAISNLVGSEYASDFFIPILQQLDNNTIISNWSTYDSDMDGAMDAVIVFHSGYAAEYRRGSECNASNFIHRIHSQGHEDIYGDWYDEDDGYTSWTNLENTISLSGYAIASIFDYVCTDTPATMGVVTHEWLHIIGAPDLYGQQQPEQQVVGGRNSIDINFGIRGLGSYDIMSNAFGPISNGTPASLSAYTKYVIGWIKPNIATMDGMYVLQFSNKSSNALIIYHEMFADNEYMLIEFRPDYDYDKNLFGGGVLIYHVDDNQRIQGSSTYPNTTISHYKVSILQADGNYDIELGINNGDSGDFWKAGMILQPSIVDTAIDQINHPNTDSYYNGITGIVISILNITSDDIPTATIQVHGLQNERNSSFVSSNSTSPSTLTDTLPQVEPSQSPTESMTITTNPSEIQSNIPSNPPSMTHSPILFFPTQNINVSPAPLPKSDSIVTYIPSMTPMTAISRNETNNINNSSSTLSSAVVNKANTICLLMSFLSALFTSL